MLQFQVRIEKKSLLDYLRKVANDDLYAFSLIIFRIKTVF